MGRWGLRAGEGHYSCGGPHLDDVPTGHLDVKTARTWVRRRTVVHLALTGEPITWVENSVRLVITHQSWAVDRFDTTKGSSSLYEAVKPLGERRCVYDGINMRASALPDNHQSVGHGPLFQEPTSLDIERKFSETLACEDEECHSSCKRQESMSRGFNCMLDNLVALGAAGRPDFYSSSGGIVSESTAAGERPNVASTQDELPPGCDTSALRRDFTVRRQLRPQLASQFARAQELHWCFEDFFFRPRAMGVDDVGRLDLSAMRILQQIVKVTRESPLEYNLSRSY